MKSYFPGILPFIFIFCLRNLLCVFLIALQLFWEKKKRLEIIHPQFKYSLINEKTVYLFTMTSNVSPAKSRTAQ